MSEQIPHQILEFCTLIGVDLESSNPAELFGELLWAQLLKYPDDSDLKNQALQKLQGQQIGPAYAEALVKFAGYYGFDKEASPFIIALKLETLCHELALILREVSQGKRELGSIREVVKAVVLSQPDFEAGQ